MIAPGTRLGPYAITAPIGAGGMGEVYRATDSNLGRQVAIKILPDAFADDPDRLARFEREAKTLASLNHPNIAIIHGFEKADGIRALVMELVEGSTLADRIAQGPIPVDEALPIAKQIAEALEAAHEQGIIHRDLKPANVKVRPDGTVKVLDFGLAKALDSGPTTIDASHSPTITSPAMMSGVGMLLGTAAYMSPEQARGKTVDKRTDIWAFGCVLYEMLTGRPAFQGESVIEVLASVVGKEPAWGKVPPSVPVPVQRLLRRCLTRDPHRRLRHIGDAILELDDAPHPETQGSPISVPRRRFALAAGAIVVAGLAATATLWRPAAARPNDVVRFTVLPPAGWVVPRNAPRVGRTNASDSALAVSPDGRQIAFIGSKEGQSVLFVQALDSLSSQSIAGTEGASSPFWSPDSQSLGFFATDSLKRVDLAGGTPVTLCDAPNPRGGTWNGDAILFGMQGQPLHRVSSLGGIPAAVTTLRAGETGHNRPFFLPGGRRYIFRAQTASGPGPNWVRGPVLVGSLDTNEITNLIESDSGNAQFADGRLLFVRGNALLAQAFDPNTLALSGEAVRVAEGLEMNGNPPVAKFSVAARTLIYRSGNTGPGRSSLQWFDRSGRLLGTAAEPDLMASPELAPDGRAIAVSRTDAATNTSDIWVLEGTRRTRLTFDVASDASPVWSPDGRSIAFRSNRTRTNEIYLQAADGSSDAQLLLEGPDSETPTDWSTDGRFLLYELTNAQTVNLSALRLLPSRTSIPLVDSIYDERDAKFSPDGRWVAYVSRESGADEVHVRPFPGPGGQWQISMGGGVQPRWSRDGRELVYLEPGGMLMAVSISSAGGSFVPGQPQPLFQTRMLGGASDREYDVGLDGRFLVNAPVNEAGATPITVFLNWTPR